MSFVMLYFLFLHLDFLNTAGMRLVSMGVRVRRNAEPSEPETEHEFHPSTRPHHDYENMKNKFMNELEHLPCE